MQWGRGRRCARDGIGCVRLSVLIAEEKLNGGIGIRVVDGKVHCSHRFIDTNTRLRHILTTVVNLRAANCSPRTCRLALRRSGVGGLCDEWYGIVCI